MKSLKLCRYNTPQPIMCGAPHRDPLPPPLLIAIKPIAIARTPHALCDTVAGCPAAARDSGRENHAAFSNSTKGASITMDASCQISSVKTPSRIFDQLTLRHRHGGTPSLDILCQAPAEPQSMLAASVLPRKARDNPLDITTGASRAGIRAFDQIVASNGFEGIRPAS